MRMKVWMAYRGHEIERGGGGHWVVIRNGQRVFVAESEQAAIDWVNATEDERKRDRTAREERRP